MGFLKSFSGAVGHVDKGLLKRGLLARGTVIECKRGSMTTGTQVKSVVCKLTVEVELEDRPLYTAECHHPIPMPYLPQFESGKGAVAVRVDPEDPSQIALDLTHDVPPPRGGAATGPLGDTTTITGAEGLPPEVLAALQSAGATAAAPPAPTPGADGVTAVGILATGTPCRAIIASAPQPLGPHPDGSGEALGLVLSVFADGEDPFQVQVGLSVPPNAIALAYPGANLPAKRFAGVVNAVAIDWAAALAETRGGA